MKQINYCGWYQSFQGLRKVWVYIVLFLFSFSLSAQVNDTLVVDRMVDSLEKVWNNYLSSGKYAEILPLLETARLQIKNQIGEESVSYARVLNYRGIVHYYLQRWPEAESDYTESMNIHKRLSGELDNSVAMGLNNLAYLYMVRGRYDEAEKMYKEALVLREKMVGRESQDYAWTINNLGILYSNTGRYEECEPLFRQAMDIRAKNPGKQHPVYAGSLNNLASLYMFMGRYEAAEPLYLEALNIKEKAKGKENPDYSGTLENLAILYDKLGRYKESEKFYLESKAIKEKILRPEDPEFASLLMNLGVFFETKGKSDLAESFLMQALAIKEKAFGMEDLEVSSALINLVKLKLAAGKIFQAEPLLFRAQSIIKKSVGVEHDDYALILSLHAEILSLQKDYEKALVCLLEGRNILEKLFGKMHPRYRKLLLQLAFLYEKMELFEKSENLYRESFEIERAELRKGAQFLSESELTDYVSSFKQDNESLISLAVTRLKHGRDVSTLVGICYDNALFYKGFLMDAANQVNTISYKDTNSISLQLKLKSLRRRLSNQYAMSAKDRDSLVVLDLEIRANKVEKELVTRIARISESVKELRWKDVQKRLKDREASIEILSYTKKEKDQSDSTFYVALVVKADLPVPRLVPLFEEHQLSRLLNQGREHRLDYVNQLYTFSGRGAIDLSGKEAGLHELIWKPLSFELEGIKTIFLAPAGLLHLVNLAAIPLSDSEVLADRYQLINMGSTRKMLTSASPSGQQLRAVLFGGVVYDVDSISLVTNVSDAGTQLTSRAGNQKVSTENSQSGENWMQLKWTEKEVRSIDGILKLGGYQTKMYNGTLATEESFKIMADQSIRPALIHMATHGFFFADPKTLASSVQIEERAFKESANPLIRSGLLLAGANHAWKTGHTISRDAEDGILTAYEISQLDLSGTQLAVLSACETGLGDIEGSEGVYGLQRAFKVAGVKYIIMSLWQVPDKQTSMLMIAFYKKWLEEMMSIQDAFHAAQKELRDLGLDPYQWAGFVLVE